MRYIFLAPIFWITYGVFVVSKPVWNVWIFYAFQLILTGSLLRNLHEITHMAIHRFFEGSLGAILSDVFYHYPCGMDNFHDRVKSHCFGHHKHVANDPNDPSVEKLKAAGLKMGLRKFDFYKVLMFPLTVGGLSSRIRSLLYKERENMSQRCFRLIGLVVPAYVIFLINRSFADTFVYCIGLVAVGPTFHWVSLLCEHPWFFERENQAGPPLHYIKFSGIYGFILKRAIFCYTDNLHALHHVKPRLDFVQLEQWSEGYDGKRFIGSIKQYKSIFFGRENNISVLQALWLRVSYQPADIKGEGNGLN